MFTFDKLSYVDKVPDNKKNNANYVSGMSGKIYLYVNGNKEFQIEVGTVSWTQSRDARMEPKVPIKEKISKFWNRPNPQNDLGILGAAAGGLIGGLIKATGLTGRQKATYDVSLSTQYFYNQNKPEFGTIRKKKAEQNVINRRNKASSGFIKTIQQPFMNIQNYKSEIPENENINMKMESDSNNPNEFKLNLNYGTKKLGAYKIKIFGANKMSK